MIDSDRPRRAVEQGIMHEVHAPPLVGAVRGRWNATMQAGVLTASDRVPQLQSFQSIQAPYTLHVHVPALTSQQYMVTAIAVPWARVRELAQPLQSFSTSATPGDAPYNDPHLGLQRGPWEVSVVAALTRRAIDQGMIVVGAVPAAGRTDGFPAGVPGVIAVDTAEQANPASVARETGSGL